jgi:hypothetical protein
MAYNYDKDNQAIIGIQINESIKHCDMLVVKKDGQHLSNDLRKMLEADIRKEFTRLLKNNVRRPIDRPFHIVMNEYAENRLKELSCEYCNSSIIEIHNVSDNSNQIKYCTKCGSSKYMNFEC